MREVYRGLMEHDKHDPLLFLSPGRVALLSGLDRDTIFPLTKKGVLNPVWNSEGEMIFSRKEIARWMREKD